MGWVVHMLTCAQLADLIFHPSPLTPFTSGARASLLFLPRATFVLPRPLFMLFPLPGMLFPLPAPLLHSTSSDRLPDCCIWNSPLPPPQLPPNPLFCVSFLCYHYPSSPETVLFIYILGSISSTRISMRARTLSCLRLYPQTLEHGWAHLGTKQMRVE